MKKIWVVSLVLMVTFSHSTFCQDYQESDRVFRDRSDLERGVNVYAIIPAYTISNYANLNANLFQNSFPLLPRGHLNYGFGFMYRHNRFLVGIDSFWGNQIRTIDEPGRALLKRNPWTYSINLGYHILKRDGFAFYPQVGLSYTDTNLFISKSSAPASFDEILQNPGNSVHLFHESAGLFVGLGFDAHWLFRKDSPLVSIKFGKRIQVDNPYPWDSFFTPLSNAPTDNFNYWVFQLGMGGAFNWEKKSKR